MTKGRTKPRKKGSKKKGSAAARKKKTNLWIKRLSLGTDLRLSDTGFKAPFWIMAALLLAITLVLSVNSGVNSDDFWQNKYAKNILPFYTSMGNDTTFLDPSSIGKVHYYGGFFEVIATGTSSLLGFDENDKGYHDIRHIYSGLLGVIAMVLAGLLIAHLMGWKAGLFAMLFLFLTPRFLGHSLMNPKDVPFATAYLTTIYFLTRILLELPRPKTSSLIGMAVGFGIAMGIRAGGLILVPYIFLFLGLDFILRYGVQGIFKERNELIRYAAYAFGTSIIGYAIGILFWPYALMDPINHPVEALRNFSQVWTRIKVLYGGDMIFSSSLPWHYPLVSILRTLPTFVLAGLVLSFVFLKSLLQRLPLLPVCLAYFAAFFPLLYVVANGSTLYDGWRHLLFVGPPIVICSLLGWWVLLEKLSTQLTYSRIAMGALFLMMLEPLIFTIRNHSYPYVYYNAVSGGVKKAFGNYELDYWGVGVKEAFDWLEEEGRVSPDMKDTVTIASNFRYCLSSTVRDRYNGKIKVRYVRLRQRDEVDWDYGIFVNRFVDGSYLRGGYWPTSKTIHMVKANNVPIAIIEQDEDKNAYQGNLALKSRDWDRAIQYYDAELAKHPDNEIALISKGLAHLSKGELPLAKEALDRGLVITPEGQNGLNFLGYYYYLSNNYDMAMQTFKKGIALHDLNAMARYYKGLLEFGQQNYLLALETVKDCLTANPNYPNCYDLGAKIHDQLGDAQSAQAFRNALSQLRGN